MRSQNEEEYLADKDILTFCQICFPKLTFINFITRILNPCLSPQPEAQMCLGFSLNWLSYISLTFMPKYRLKRHSFRQLVINFH